MSIESRLHCLKLLPWTLTQGASCKEIKITAKVFWRQWHCTKTELLSHVATKLLPCPASMVLPTHAAFDGGVIWSDRQNEPTAVILILISGYAASKTSFPSNFLHVLLWAPQYPLIQSLSLFLGVGAESSRCSDPVWSSPDLSIAPTAVWPKELNLFSR